MKEIWRTIPGYKGYYEVSNRGRVRSLDRIITDSLGRISRLRGRILRLHPTSDGNHRSILLAKNGINKRMLVHVIVARVFIGKKPKGKCVAHNNGRGWDNNVKNLRYDTMAGNHADKIKHGTDQRGEKHGRAKLTEEKVRVIRELRKQGKTCVSLARRFGVSSPHISFICSRRFWRHVK